MGPLPIPVSTLLQECFLSLQYAEMCVDNEAVPSNSSKLVSIFLETKFENGLFIGCSNSQFCAVNLVFYQLT